MIAVRGLTVDYRVHRREPGLRAALRSLFHRPYETVSALDRVSFEVREGERVALLGPNGAGKTTLLKVLAGLLFPTAGEVHVAGARPQDRSTAFLKGVSLVLGQKQQLLWDLPPSETFELNRVLYDVPRGAYAATLRELDELLGLGELIRRPARQLSLGERMKCEIAAALIHRPRVLFWDEPTIGLDASMQLALRAFVRRYLAASGATLVLTSHDMDDVAALCPRVLLLDGGRLRFDGALADLSRRVRPEKIVALQFTREVARADLEALGEVIEADATSASLRLPSSQVHGAFAAALAALPVREFTVQDPPLEEIMAELAARPIEGP